MFQSPPTSFGGLESMGIILDYRGLYMEYDFSTMIIHDYGLYMIIQQPLSQLYRGRHGVANVERHGNAECISYRYYVVVKQKHKNEQMPILMLSYIDYKHDI